MCLLLNWLEGVDPSRLLKKSIRSLFDSDHPWSSPYGRYQVAPTLSRRNCQHAKQKAAAPAPPCARPCPPSRLPRHYYFPVGHGIRASCTAWFLLCFIFQTLSVFEKSAGSGFSRRPRRGLAQGGVKQKWRYFLRCAFLLRLKARAGLPWPARSAGGRSTGPSSNSASPLYRDGQEAQVPRKRRDARERPPQGAEKRVFQHPAKLIDQLNLFEWENKK